MHHVSEVTVPWSSGAAAAAPDKHVLVKPSDNRIRRNADRDRRCQSIPWQSFKAWS